MVVERLKGCENIVALSKELGVHRRLLYKWRDQLEPIDGGEMAPENGKERELRLQVAQLKRLVADKTLEADFFRGALQIRRGAFQKVLEEDQDVALLYNHSPRDLLARTRS